MQEESHFLIVGLGLLGGSYAQGLKRKGFHVSALDINPESIAYALKQGWIDEWRRIHLPSRPVTE